MFLSYFIYNIWILILQVELEEDIFRIYDVDNNGTIEFKVIPISAG